MINSKDEYVIGWKITLVLAITLGACELTFENLDMTKWEIDLYPKELISVTLLASSPGQMRQNCYKVFRMRNGVQTSNIRLPIENLQNVTICSLELLRVKTAKENDFLTLIVHTGKDESFGKNPEEASGLKDVDSASNSLLHIGIERSKPLTTPIYLYVFCRVKLVDKDKSFPFELAEEYIYKGQLQKEFWNISRFIKIKELTKDMIQDNTLLEFNIHACYDLQRTYLEEDLTPQRRLNTLKTIRL
ncbi:hypothetical protein TNCT_451431 [Trichonephila clavata]|uniref:Lipoprotein n=1 Tax=Trichonephila clavata TaxID=2740835 RepID=A0A8X6FVU1_TRICU|nr:hypothetical protein TNCT_451431 [Trichonephila clavata]